MQDASQQEPTPRNTAGYRPLVPVEFTRTSASQVYAYVGAAAGLGLLFGMVIAVTAAHGHVSAAPRVSDALQSHTSGLSALPAVYTGPAPSLLSQVDSQKKANAGTPVLEQAADKQGKKAAGSHKKHGFHRFWNWKKGSGKLNAGAKRTPYVSPNGPASADEPTALQMANAAAASGPFFVGIEGDVTVAGYDGSAGSIQTYEGNNFVLDKGAGASGAIAWQDFPFNVHYRCDATGNCTLMRGSATAVAKRTR